MEKSITNITIKLQSHTLNITGCSTCNFCHYRYLKYEPYCSIDKNIDVYDSNRELNSNFPYNKVSSCFPHNCPLYYDMVVEYGYD